MDLQLIQLAVKSLSQDLEQAKGEIKSLQLEIAELRRRPATAPVEQKTVPQDDDLLTLKEARAMLKVCRNVFLEMVKTGIIKQIRMHRRTLRYSKIAIQDFIGRNR
jgi:hypothetical protein